MSERTGFCVHCGQDLPHKGTGWREAYRCRLFQGIAEKAWDEGHRLTRPHSDACEPTCPNPYRATTQPEATRPEPTEQGASK